MKFFQFVIVLLVMACSSKKTRLRVDNIVVDNVKFNDTVQGEAKVYNVGDTDLKINKVAGTCECTATTFDSGFIKKGGFAKIFYKIKLSKPGHFIKKITFEANTELRFHSFIISGNTSSSSD